MATSMVVRLVGQSAQTGARARCDHRSFDAQNQKWIKQKNEYKDDLCLKQWRKPLNQLAKDQLQGIRRVIQTLGDKGLICISFLKDKWAGRGDEPRRLHEMGFDT